MKQFAPGFRGGSYSESDDLNMQIEMVNGQAFLDRWAGGGWKNISVHKTYDDALRARSEIAAKIRARGGEMTRGEIIRLAEEAGFEFARLSPVMNTEIVEIWLAAMAKFAALVAAAERDACAAVCREDWVELKGWDMATAEAIRKAIRARGQE